MSERFREWVLRHDIGPSMNDIFMNKDAPASIPKNYSGIDGTVGDGWMDILDRLAKVETIPANRGKAIVVSAGVRGFQPWLETGGPGRAA